MSGQTAVFNSGSELSVPKPQPDGSLTMERQYGIMVKLTPEVLGDRVHLAIHGQLSELDYGHIVRVGRETVPDVQTREFDTRTELASGQTLAISGLTYVRVEAIARGVPYVSEIPYVGAAFRSVEEERNDMDLLILRGPRSCNRLQRHFTLPPSACKVTCPHRRPCVRSIVRVIRPQPQPIGPRKPIFSGRAKVAAGVRNSPAQEPRLQGDSSGIFPISGRDLAWSPGWYMRRRCSL